MKEAIYNNLKKSLKNFNTITESITYYQYLIKNNPESSTYPKELKELHKGLIIGLQHNINNEVKKMKIEVKQMTNGIQHINRIYFTADDGTLIDIDLWDDELKELKEQIEQRFTEPIG